MEIEGEAVADTVTGGIVAATAESELNAPGVRGDEVSAEPLSELRGAVDRALLCGVRSGSSHPSQSDVPRP